MTWDRLIEEKIKQAQAEGQFDNLPGQGKPLPLDENPYEAPEWRMAHKALKNAGFAPDWVELDRGLRDQLEAARAALVRSRDWRDAALAALGSRRDVDAQRERDLIADEWNRALCRFEDAIGAINKSIADLNLKVPLARFQRLKVSVEEDLRKLGLT